MIRFEQFGFTYENSGFGVKDIDLTVQSGELLVLTGPSGCGKTTLTRCINGLIPDFYEGTITGRCTVCGMDITQQETGDFSAKVGSVFQDPRSQFFTMQVRTELPFPSENLGLPRKTLQGDLQKTVSELSLQPLLDRSIFALSSGEKQKIATASVYAAGVEIYVLDEPSANLDRDGTEQLRQLLEKLKGQGKTVVISEHKLYYLRDLADRVVWMRDGRIRRVFSGAEFAALSPQFLTEHGLRQTELSKVPHSVPKVKAVPDAVRLEVFGLSFHYPGGKPLWQNVSFSCRGGEIVGIVGKNGAGKTTLCRVLMGLEKPSAGIIQLNGKSASKRQRRKATFSVVQDVDYQLIAGSIAEELRMGHERDPDMEEKIRQVLNRFSLGDYADSHPTELSGGQKQRLSIALACLSGKKILFFDEPTSGLDAVNMALVRSSIVHLAEGGCLCFVITHDDEFTAGLFTSLLTIGQDGTIRYQNAAEQDPNQLIKYDQ